MFSSTCGEVQQTHSHIPERDTSNSIQQDSLSDDKGRQCKVTGAIPLHQSKKREGTGGCNGIAFNNLDQAGNYLGTGIGIVLVLPGRRILDGKPGVSG